MNSALKNVSPKRRSEIQHGISLISLLVTHKQIGFNSEYVNISHPDIPVVCPTLKPIGAGFLKTRR